MNLYSYYTNIFDNKGNVIKIIGNNKTTIEKAFKDLNVKLGERTKSKVNHYLVEKYKTIDDLLEAQKQILINRLKLKQFVIKNEVYKNDIDIKQLEEKYTISIQFNGSYYMVYNMFGELWFTSHTLEAIENEMKKFYKIFNEKEVEKCQN